MDPIVEPARDRWQLRLPDGRVFACAVGRGGVAEKRGEGDGITPVGRWPVRRALYRPDRVSPPGTALPLAPIDPHDGWCDDPADPANYNRPVRKPYAGSHEDLWRADRLYDLIVVLGFNDAPPVPGAGSAIFLHVARDGFPPTAGCIALAPDALARVIGQLAPASHLIVETTGDRASDRRTGS